MSKHYMSLSNIPNYIIKDNMMYDTNQTFLTTTMKYLSITPSISTSRPSTSESQRDHPKSPQCKMTLKKLNEIRDINKSFTFSSLHDTQSEDLAHNNLVEQVRMRNQVTQSSALEDLMRKRQGKSTSASQYQDFSKTYEYLQTGQINIPVHQNTNDITINVDERSPDRKIYNILSPEERLQKLRNVVRPVAQKTSLIQQLGKYYQLEIDEAKLNIVQQPQRQVQISCLDQQSTLITDELQASRYEMAYDLKNLQMKSNGYSKPFIKFWNQHLSEVIAGGQKAPRLKYCPDIKKPEKYFVPNSVVGRFVANNGVK